MKTFFVNKNFETALRDYLLSKNNPYSILYNSFFVVIIRMLVNIYGELDIINPYKLHTQEELFNNLKKFGYSEIKLQKFFDKIDDYDEFEEYFIEIQKDIIDMFNKKRINYGVTEGEKKVFFELLYTPECLDPFRISFNYFKAKDINEILNYYKQSLSKINFDDEYLSINTLDEFDIDIKDINVLDGIVFKEKNKDKYNEIDFLDDIEPVKDEIFPKQILLTGNGYVDILLIMSIIITVAMTISIFAFIVI